MSLARIAVGAVRGGLQSYRPAGDELLDDVRPAVLAVVALLELRCTDISVHGGYAGVRRDIVQRHLLHADRRLGVAEVKESAGGAHGAEGARRNHVHFLGGALHALALDIWYDLLCGHDHHVPVLDPLVDLRDRPLHPAPPQRSFLATASSALSTEPPAPPLRVLWESNQNLIYPLLSRTRPTETAMPLALTGSPASASAAG